jgi:hypothetical protein
MLQMVDDPNPAYDENDGAYRGTSFLACEKK